MKKAFFRRSVRPLFALLCWSGCTSPDVASSLEKCGPDGECPLDFECDRVDRRCHQSATVSPDGGPPDALLAVDAATPDTSAAMSADGSPDATLPIDAAGQPPDARPIDAGVDAAPDATVSGPVMITAFGVDWQPLASADVIAHDADGNVLGTTTTTAAGVATIVAPEGGMITLAASNADQLYLTTVTGVRPGDALAIKTLTGRRLDGPPVGSVTVKYPGAYPSPASLDYGAGTTCQTSLGVVTDPTEQPSGTLYRDCVDAATAEAIGVAEDTTAQGTETLAFSFGSTAITNGTATVALGPWKSATTLELTVDNVPAAAQANELSGSIIYGTAIRSTSRTMVSANQFRLSVPSEGTGIALRVDVGTTFGLEGVNISAALLRAVVPLPGASARIDASAAGPHLHGLTVDDAASKRPTLSWMVEGSTALLVGGFAFLVWPSPGAGQPTVSWTIVIAPRLSVRAPALPPLVAAKVPTTVPSALVMFGVPAAPIDSYDKFRIAFSPFVDPKARQWQRLSYLGSVFR